MKRCALLSCNLRVSSTDQMYQWAAKRRGDKFDRSMTQGKLLDNDTQLFIFISILIMTPTSPKGPRKQTTEPILGPAFLEKKKPVPTGWMEKRGLLLSANNAQFVTSVD